MIRLFGRNETNFNHNETVLSDVLAAKVVEEANGMFELELDYPRNEFAKTLTAGKIIKVPTARGEQLFRIYKPKKSLTRYKIYARHIFYDLAKNFIEDIRPTNKAGMAAVADILNAAQYEHPFTGTSNISNIGTAYYMRLNPVQALLGADNSFVATWGGELVRDNFSFSLNANGGQNRGYEIRLGKNLTGIEIELEESNVYTRIYPTVVIENNVVTTLPEKYVDSPLINNYENPKIIEERISLTTDQKDWQLEDIYSLMRDHCAALFADGVDKPAVNYKVDFVELSKTEQYKHLAILEQLDLYDTVTINVPELDIDVQAKVVKTTYDALKERYISMELGSFAENMASQAKNTLANTEKKINAATSSLQQAFDRAQELITGNLGGHVVMRLNAEQKPYEILIMDTEDINTATNVIRMNQQGIGFSNEGFNGPFGVAITIDGHIVADFMDTGILTADLIKTGMLTGTNMTLNVDGGSMTFTHPTTGDKLTLTQGGIIFGEGTATERFLQYTSEGLKMFPGTGNTGTNLNTSLRLHGGVTYIDFFDDVTGTVPESTHRARVESNGEYIYLRTANGESVSVVDWGGNPRPLKVGSITIDNPTLPAYLWANHWETPRDGNRDLIASPNGTGKFKVCTPDETAYYAVWASSFDVSSSIEFKKAIEDYTGNATALINGTPVRSYYLNEDIEGVDMKRIGLIVQESPLEIVNTDGGKTIDLYEMAALLWKGNQELSAKIDALEARIAALEI